mmetsp:Transcript_9623/g.13336  ORF Transcript_9623/g.13336 Transcript_9623/m.13336 type:complete len:415 (-) Transcript_9623:550-1794(-)
MASPTKRPRLDEDESPVGSEKEVGSCTSHSCSSSQREVTSTPQYPSAPHWPSQHQYPHPAPLDSIRIANEQDISIGRLGYLVQREISELMTRQPRLREELEACCFDSLCDFDEGTAIEIVRKFGQRDLNTIRNATAYFCGLLKHYRERGAAFLVSRGGMTDPNTYLVSPAGFYTHPVMSSIDSSSSSSRRGMHQHVAHTPQGQAEQAQSIALLTPAVRDAVETIFTIHGVRRYEMEPCCFESLRDFSEPIALSIVNEFRNADMNTLRDKTAYFCSILKRYRSQGQGNRPHPLSQHYFSTRGPTPGRVTPRRSAAPTGWNMAAFCDSPQGATIPSVIRDSLYMAEPTSPWTGQNAYSFDSADPYGTSLQPHPGTIHANPYGAAPYPPTHHSGLLAAPPTAFYAQVNAAPWGPYIT